MSIETFYLMQRDAPRPSLIADLSAVEVLRDVETDDGATVPAGTRGTVVATWADGEAYEVEFAPPIAGLATVISSAVREV